MIKRLLSFIIVLTVLLGSSITAEAATASYSPAVMSDGSKVFVFEDGSRLTVSAPRCAYSSSDPSKTLQTKTVQIDSSFVDSNGEPEWRYTLTCVFSYEYGVSSTCTNAYYNQTIYQGNWTFSNGAATVSGNRGTGTGHYEKKILFITVKSIDVLLTLTCDVYGNVTA